MIREDIKQIKSSPHDLKMFGLVVGGVFALLGAYFLFRERNPGEILLAIGVLLIGWGLFAPSLLKPLQKAWMALAILLGFAVTNAILTVFFYVGLTPVALLARLCGKRFLDLSFHSKNASYWVPRAGHASGKIELEKQS